MPQKETGVYRRSGSNHWQLRIKAPKELAHFFPPSGIAWRGSLSTSDLKVANSLALAKRAQLDKRFAELRVELGAERVDSFTPALVQELAARVTTATLAADERLRTDPEAAQTVLAPVALAAAQTRLALAIGTKALALPRGFTEPVDPWMGMPADVAATLAALNEMAATSAAENWASQRVLAVLPLAQAEARRIGFTFDRTTPGALEVLAPTEI